MVKTYIESDFESGNIEDVERIGSSHFSCRARKDTSPYALWFYFKIENAAGKEITIDLVNTKETLGGPFSWNEVRPVFSYDQKNWSRINNVKNIPEKGIFSFKYRFKKDPVWIAYCYPYTYTDLLKCLEKLKENPYVKIDDVGKSEEGRTIYALTITDYEAEKKKIGVCLTARHHAGETPGSHVLNGILEFLLSDDEIAQKMRSSFIFLVFPMVDIDGVYNGRYGKDSKPVDFYSDWDVNSKPLRPEIRVIQKVIDNFATQNNYSIFIDLHAPCSHNFNYFYIGPSEKLPIRYYMNQLRFLKIFERNCPELYCSTDYQDPEALSGFIKTSSWYQYYKYGVLSMTAEISYHKNRFGEYMSIASMRLFGKGLAKAIYDYFKSLRCRNI